VKAVFKHTRRKESNLTTRRLAPQETETVTTIFETTNLTKLNHKEQKAFTSIKSQFERYQQLSNKQLNYLETLHSRSKRGVYGTAESDVDRIAHKLSTVFNPIGRAR
jgi:hypothetical protein